jgi:hypothetical protein
MISGTKISQLPVITTFQDTDYVPVQRGSTTNRASGLTIKNTALSAFNNAIPIRYINNTLSLSSNTITLTGTQVNIITSNVSVTGSQIISANSSDSALRVTQIGSGNALTVEDSTNPDVTPFAITSGGSVGIGTLAPTNKLQIHTTSSSTSADAHILITQTSNSNSGFVAVDSAGYTRIGSVSGIGFITGTGQVVSILSGGRVGINTTNPNQQLTVSGNISASNNIIANAVFANLSGNANTANALLTPRTILLSGSILGNISFNGTQDVTIQTTLSTGVIVNNNIADNAAISDIKLGPIVSDKKVSPTAIDYTGSLPNQVLMSTGTSTVWKSLSSTSFVPLSNSVTNQMLNFNAVTTDRIANQAVTTEKIADGSINTQKLSAESITTTLIANSAVTTDKIDNFAITTAKIADQAITEVKILDSAITTAKISVSSISTDKIANNAITTDKIVTGAVTPEKAYAFASATPNSFVLRDSLGNLSATEVTANLKGNAQTASSWQNSTTLKLTGAVVGQTTFNGSASSVTLNTGFNRPVPFWVVYKANPASVIQLSSTFVQGTSSQLSNLITVTQLSSTSNTRQEYGSFTQQGNTTVIITLTSTNFVPWFNETYLNYNLTVGSNIYAAFTGNAPLPTNNNYIIDNVITDLTSVKIEIDSGLVQSASGNVIITYDQTLLQFQNNLQPGHLVNAYFINAAPLSGITASVPVSGLYRVTNVFSPYSYELSSSISQSASGSMFIKQCIVTENYGVRNVAYKDTGRHILNFEWPFDGSSLAPYHLCFAGSGTLGFEEDLLLTGPYSSSIERTTGDLQTAEYTEIRTILNSEGSLKYHNFNRTNVILLGNTGSVL